MANPQESKVRAESAGEWAGLAKREATDVMTAGQSCGRLEDLHCEQRV